MAQIQPAAQGAWGEFAASLPPGLRGNFNGLDLDRPDNLASFVRVMELTGLKPGQAPPGFSLFLAASVEAAACEVLRKAKAGGNAPELRDLVQIQGFFHGKMKEKILAAAGGPRADLPKAGELASLREAEEWLGPEKGIIQKTLEVLGLAKDRKRISLNRLDGLLEELKSDSRKARREAERELLGVRWTPELRGRLREEFLHGGGLSGNSSLAGVLASRPFGRGATGLLAWLYPEYEREILDFYPEGSPMGADIFGGSVFSRPAAARGWVEALRRLKGFSPEAYDSFREDHRPFENGVAQHPLIAPAPAERFRDAGYKLLYPVRPSSGEFEPERQEYFELTEDLDESLSAALRRSQKVFDRLIEANFQVLQSMSAQAGELSRSGAEGLLAQAESMGRLFGEYQRSWGKSVEKRVLESLRGIRRRLRLGWRGLGGGEKLPADLSKRVYELDKERPFDALHSWINWVHQKALELHSAQDDDGAETLNGSAWIDRGGFFDEARSLSFTYLGEEPLSVALAKSRGLKGLLRELPIIPRVDSDTLYFNETQVWLQSRLGAHSAEIFADFSDPDDGGMLRVRYEESGVENGSEFRLAFIAAFLGKFGIRAEIEGDSFLNAVLDKDRGLASSRAVAEALPAILRFLHDSRDVDLMLKNMREEEGKSRGSVFKFARKMADVYFAEGGWAFDSDDCLITMMRDYREYLRKAPWRSALRVALDAELKRLGLDPFPKNAPMGQWAVDRHFNRPVMEAAARGDILFDGKSRPARVEGSALERLVRAVSEDFGASAEAASVLAALESGSLDFSPIGEAGALRAELAQETLDDGSILTVLALREPSSGRLALARASLWTLADGPRPLSAGRLREVLGWNGFAAGEEEALTEPQAEGLRRMLRSPIDAGPDERPWVRGLPASPGGGGFSEGVLTFDRASKAVGAILAVPYTSPDDLEAIGRSAGVLTTGGGALSHAAITTRELGIPSAILPSARWIVENGKPALSAGLVRRGPSRALPGGVEAAGLVPEEDGTLREGDLVRLDGRTGSVELVARAGDPRYAALKDGLLQAVAASIKTVKAGLPRAVAPPRAEVEPGLSSLGPAIFPLSAIDGSLTPLVGGKSAKLGEMSGALRATGASVPGGAALSFRAYERFLDENGLRGKIASLAAELDAGADAGRLSQAIRREILSGRLDPARGMGKEILDSLRARPGSLWAVRSSAIQEDTDDAAFAGAAESYLFVKPEDILARVVENWASFWLPRGILYRRSHGLVSSELKPATLIQEMVPAEKSGVVFTRNPATSADEAVIDAVYGIGEGAVSGAAEADSYSVRKEDGVEAALPHVAFKRWKVESSPEGSGTRLVRVPRALREARVLDRGQTAALAEVASAIEERFGRPMDIEFSIHDGRIFILQARPITTP
jgi:hypothetical protein